MICEECGTEINEQFFYDTCKACGKTLCLNCIRVNSLLDYTCGECLVNGKNWRSPQENRSRFNPKQE